MSHPYESFMREAAELAERGRWSAAPNPVSYTHLTLPTTERV